MVKCIKDVRKRRTSPNAPKGQAVRCKTAMKSAVMLHIYEKQKQPRDATLRTRLLYQRCQTLWVPQSRIPTLLGEQKSPMFSLVDFENTRITISTYFNLFWWVAAMNAVKLLDTSYHPLYKTQYHNHQPTLSGYDREWEWHPVIGRGSSLYHESLQDGEWGSPH